MNLNRTNEWSNAERSSARSVEFSREMTRNRRHWRDNERVFHLKNNIFNCFIFLPAGADLGFSVWDRYTSDEDHPPVAYVSHLVGALAGLTVGLLVLKTFEHKLHAQILWWIALVVSTLCTTFAVLWNIFYY